MKGKRLFAVSAVLLLALLMGMACGCGSDGDTEIPPPAPNEGGFQSEGGNCGACGQEGYEPMKAGSYLTIDYTTYDLTCGIVDIRAQGFTSGSIQATLITSTCDQATLRLEVKGKIFDTEHIYVDSGRQNSAEFLEVLYQITEGRDPLNVDSSLNPTHIWGTVNSDKGPISFNLDL